MRIVEYDEKESAYPSANPSIICEYTLSSTEEICSISKKANLPIKRKHGHIFHATKGIVKDLFLPIGFPDSVGPAYLKYQLFDSLQGFCTYIRGVVSTSAVLKASGVGDAAATSMSAAQSWAFRDGVGMIGGLLFSYMASSSFDSHVKEYRLFADVINDVGLTIDMVTPLFPRDRIPLVMSFANVCKVMCGMSAGATKASITVHFAKRGNMADLNAKESTQETLVTLIGLVCGTFTARFLNRLDEPTEQKWIWTMYLVLTVLHIWANYMGVNLLRLKTLNRMRTECAFKELLDKCMHSLDDGAEKVQLDCSVIKSPEEVCESLLSSIKYLFFPGNIHLGVKFGDICVGSTHLSTIWSLKEFENDKYLLFLDNRGRVSVLLRRGAEPEDELKSFLHALLLERCFLSSRLVDSKEDQDKRLLIHRSHQCLNNMFLANDKSLLGILSECGWDSNNLYLGFGRWRVEWTGKKE